MNANTILEKATPMLHKMGPKTVTMSDVSRMCGISKKTLYQYFPKKEDLLEATIEQTLQGINEVINDVRNQNLNAIQEILSIFQSIYNNVLTDQDVFMFQLMKYYPKIHESCSLKSFQTHYDSIYENLEKGILEGSYTSDFDKDLLVRFLLANLKSIKNSDIYQETHKNHKQITFFTLSLYLNAITTTTGKTTLNQLKEQYEN